MLGSSGAVAGCAAETGTGALPRVRFNMISTDEQPTLAENEGIVAGVAIVATTPTTGLMAYTTRRMAFDYRFGRVDGTAIFSIPVLPTRSSTVELEENGVWYLITPFAMVAPAGRYNIMELQRLIDRNNWRWSRQYTPDGYFDIVSDRVNYIGGLGVLYWRAGSNVSFSSSFLRSDQRRDEPLIRSAFPSIASMPMTHQAIAASAGYLPWPIDVAALNETAGQIIRR